MASKNRPVSKNEADSIKEVGEDRCEYVVYRES